MDTISKLQSKMIDYYAGDPKRIQHFIKVHSFAKLIGTLEQLEPGTLFILEGLPRLSMISVSNCVRKSMVTAMENFRKQKDRLLPKNYLRI